MLLKLARINKVHITKSVKLKAFKYAEEKYNKEQEAKRLAEEEEKKKLEQQEENKENA